MTIRSYFPVEEIDYVALTCALSGYAKPRDKIRSMLARGELVRIKKGLYVFGPGYALQPYLKETLANLIYGPSCISLEYALSFYGLIPERVDTLTCVTSKRDKAFKTPVGAFTYRYLHPDKYPIGINSLSLDERHAVLIASKEKALADVLTLNKALRLPDRKALETCLFEELRIDADQLRKLDKRSVERLQQAYRHQNLSHLTELLGDLYE